MNQNQRTQPRYLIVQNSEPSWFRSVVSRLLDLMDDDRKLKFLVLALAILAVVGFVAALEFGWIDMIGNLF